MASSSEVFPEPFPPQIRVSPAGSSTRACSMHRRFLTSSSRRVMRVWLTLTPGRAAPRPAQRRCKDARAAKAPRTATGACSRRDRANGLRPHAPIKHIGSITETIKHDMTTIGSIFGRRVPCIPSWATRPGLFHVEQVGAAKRTPSTGRKARIRPVSTARVARMRLPRPPASAERSRTDTSPRLATLIAGS